MCDPVIKVKSTFCESFKCLAGSSSFEARVLSYFISRGDDFLMPEASVSIRFGTLSKYRLNLASSPLPSHVEV